MKNTRGITLIALVITIVILVILAGVAVNLIVEENGLINKAKQAQTDYNLAKEKEELELEIVNIQTKIMSEENRNATLNDLYAKIDKNKYTIELRFEPVATLSNINTIPTYSVVNKIGSNYYFIVNSKLVITDVRTIDKEDDDNKKYLYNCGKVSEEAKQFVGASDYNAEHSINADHIYINVTGTTGCNLTYIGTENKINLQDYAKICCLVTTGDNAVGSGNFFKLAINDTKLPTVMDTPYIKAMSDTVQANQINYVLEWKIPITYRNDNNYVGFISTLKDVYVYKIWLEPINEYMIYNEGKICEEAKQFVGVSDIYAEHVMNSNNIYTNVTGTTGYNFTYVGTENKINLQNYAKICCLVTTGDNAVGSGNIFKLAINDTKLPTGLDEPYIKAVSDSVQANQSNYVLKWEIPITYRNDNYYIGFISTLKDVYVYKIWLEPIDEYMIYNEGKVCGEAKQFVGASDFNAEYLINADHIYTNVTGTTGYNLTYVGTENKINLQYYNKICCLVTTGDNAVGSGNVFKLAINDTKLPTVMDTPYIKEMSDTVQANQSNYILKWEIPENYKNANNYIGFIATLKDVYVYKIWLED